MSASRSDFALFQMQTMIPNTLFAHCNNYVWCLIIYTICVLWVCICRGVFWACIDCAISSCALILPITVAVFILFLLHCRWHNKCIPRLISAGSNIKFSRYHVHCIVLFSPYRVHCLILTISRTLHCLIYYQTLCFADDTTNAFQDW